MFEFFHFATCFPLIDARLHLSFFFLKLRFELGSVVIEFLFLRGYAGFGFIEFRLNLSLVFFRSRFDTFIERYWSV